jgi:hypothetical protein
MFLAAARDDYLVAELVQCFGEATPIPVPPPVMKMVFSVSFVEVF